MSLLSDTVMAPQLKPAPTQVMIVEANVSTRTIVADKLRQAGFHVVEAANTHEASTYVNARRPVDVIFNRAVLNPSAED
jgi:CheY-like chemotaxis protein